MPASRVVGRLPLVPAVAAVLLFSVSSGADRPPDKRDAVAQAEAEDRMSDMGQVAAYVQLAAWEYGVGSCIASFWEPDRAKAILGIPEELACDLAISFGYPAADWTPNKGGRKSLEEIVRWEHW